jgi:Uma2 family endonuclease
MPTTAVNFLLEPGEKVTLQPVSWQRFEAILDGLGEKRSSRVAYANGILEIMVPLPEHERTKVLLADLVKILLKFKKLAWEPLGSTTFKKQNMTVGIEPDDCFYIKNYQAVIGKERIDLSVDPPPDLSLETDVTSKTAAAAYKALGVPELWIYDSPQLKIKILVNDEYIDSNTSLTFPDIDVVQIIPQYIERAKVVGVSQALDEFEQFINN